MQPALDGDRRAGRGPRWPARPTSQRVGIYLSGLDLPVEIATFTRRAADAAVVHAGRVVVDNDTFALLRAGTASARGGRRRVRHGDQLRRPPVRRRDRPLPGPRSHLGRLGRRLRAGRAGDLARGPRGRRPRPADDARARSCPRPSVGPTMAAVIEDLHFGRPRARRRRRPRARAARRRRRRATRSPVSVVERQADEVAALALAALRRLDLVDAGGARSCSAGECSPRATRASPRASARASPLGAPRAHLTFVTDRPVLGRRVPRARGARVGGRTRSTAPGTTSATVDRAGLSGVGRRVCKELLT